MAHVRRHEQPFGESAEDAKRGVVVEDIAQQRAAIDGVEVVVVIESRERSPDHAVAEVLWSIVGRDSARELLPDAEMPRPPRDLVAELQQSGRLSSDHPFSGGTCRVNMGIDAAGEIETARGKSLDVKRQFYASHGIWTEISENWIQQKVRRPEVLGYRLPATSYRYEPPASSSRSVAGGGVRESALISARNAGLMSMWTELSES